MSEPIVSSYEKDAPTSVDAEADALLRLQGSNRRVAGREKSSGSNVGGNREGKAMRTRGGSQ